jgi:hypothetical protein
MDFTAFQHVHECGDFPRPSRLCLHVGGAHGECIEVPGDAMIVRATVISALACTKSRFLSS